MATMQTSLGTISYTDEGSGPPIVLLHAALHDRTDFAPVTEALAKGRDIQRRRLYNDRHIDTFADGFLARYTCHVVLHDGSTAALWACLVAEVRDGKIVKLSEYLDSSKFKPRRRAASTEPAS